jgi:hypothetical protein
MLFSGYQIPNGITRGQRDRREHKTTTGSGKESINGTAD